MIVTLKTGNVTVKETWEEMHYYCPYCGKYGLWRCKKDIPNKNFDGFLTEYIYLCSKCQTMFLHDIEGKKMELEWDLQRLEQLFTSSTWTKEQKRNT